MTKSNYIPALEGEALEAKRRELADIESRIKAIVGPDPDRFFDKRPSKSEPNQIQELLWDRKECLNAMFRGTPEEFERLANFNTNLVEMNEELERRADELESCHRAIHPDVDHITVLDDDPIYGSDFAYMCRLNNLNGRFGKLTKPQYLATCLDWPFNLDILMDLSPLYSPLDSLLDAQPALSKLWKHPLVQRLGLNYPIDLAIIISNYSIPDLLRIETFDVGLSTICRECTQLYK